MSEKNALSWSEEARDRLRAAAKKYGTHDRISADSGLPKPTVQKILSGTGDPGISRVAMLATTVGVSLDFILTGAGVETGTWSTAVYGADLDEARIPIFDVSVAAGVGIEGKAFTPSSHASFPRAFLRTLGDPAKMEIVRIDGDSMEPELRHRDMAMIDRSETHPRDGLVVARIGEDHVIKRLRLRGGGHAELVSNNPAYSPINVDLSADDVAIVGRVVWVGKTY